MAKVTAMAAAMTSDTDSDELQEELKTAQQERALGPFKTVMVNKKNRVAKELYYVKEYKRALAEYSQLIVLCPNNAQYYGNRAACYMMLWKYRDALVDAKKSIELDPKLFKAYVRVIKCNLALGDTMEAENTLAKLIQLDPENEAIPVQKHVLETVQKFIKDAEAAYAAKDYRKVVYCMDRCLDVSTSCTRFKLTKSECLTFLGRYQEAQKIVNDILQFDNYNVDAMCIRAICLYFQDNIDKAIAQFQQVLKLAPDHVKALEIYKKAKSLKKKKEEGNAAYKKEQYQEAYKLYSEALAIDPQNTVTNAKLHFNKAMVAAKLRRLNESVVECSEALKLDENYLKALLRRAASYMELEEFEKAVRDLEKACKLDRSRENKRLLWEAKVALKKSLRKDYYKILGIDKNASIDDIKKAYRKSAMVHHPDRHPNATEGEKKEQEKKFKDVGEAYGILSDPKKRWRYDSGEDIFEDGDGGYDDIDSRTMFHTFFNQQGPNQFRGFTFHSG